MIDQHKYRLGKVRRDKTHFKSAARGVKDAQEVKQDSEEKSHAA